MNTHTPLSRRIIRALAAPAAATLIAFAAGTGPALADAPCSPQMSSFAASNQTPGCWRPYDSSSIFNTPIPANPKLASDSIAAIRHMQRYEYHFDGTPRSFQFQSQGSRAVYFSNDNDPLVTINCTAYWGPGTCQGWNAIPIDGIQIHIPAGAQPEQAWDHHMIVVDTTTGTEYDFERASWTNSHELTVWSGNQMPLEGSGANGLKGGADAADFGLLAGIITPSQLDSGTIDHALAISVPCATGYVWPAEAPNGQACSEVNQPTTGSLPIGALLQLNMSNAQIAATGAPAWQQTIMRAMANYGMYANDTNGAPSPSTLELESQDDISYTSLGEAPQMANLVKSLGGQNWGGGDWMIAGVPIPVSKLRVINPCVQQGTCQGGSSTPNPTASVSQVHHKTATKGAKTVQVVHRAKGNSSKRHHHHKRHHHRRRHHRGKSSFVSVA